nr:MAG TPA: hypothetical protein [Bacteriophage sp.]
MLINFSLLSLDTSKWLLYYNSANSQTVVTVLLYHMSLGVARDFKNLKKPLDTTERM